MAGLENFAEWGNFLIGRWDSQEWFWSFEHFWKLKTTFCKYWTSIKIKISMACVYKEYRSYGTGAMVLVLEQWLQLKMKFLLGYNM